MVREDWYRRLAQADLLIVEARERMQSQKGHIAELTRKGQGAGRAIALLRLFEETLQLMHVQRTTILQEVRRYELPVYEVGKVGHLT